jgi:hypothetical protein
VLLSACGHQATLGDPSARPKSPADLRKAPANLDLAGPVSGHLSEVRVQDCSTRQAGESRYFNAAIYFQIGTQWYFLQLTATNRLPARDGNNYYTGPGTYVALLDFRDLYVTAGGTINGDHSWGVPVTDMAGLRVQPGEKAMTVIKVANTDYRQPTFSEELQLWPADTNTSGPAPSPVPSEGQIVHLRGSWTC